MDAVEGERGPIAKRYTNLMKTDLLDTHPYIIYIDFKGFSVTKSHCGIQRMPQVHSTRILALRTL